MPNEPDSNAQVVEVTSLAQRVTEELTVQLSRERTAGQPLPAIVIVNINQVETLVHGTLTEIKGNRVTPPSAPRTANDVLFAAIVVIMVLGIAFIVGGIALTIAGGTGTTTFTLFGNSFTSQSVGVAAIFCGAVIVALTLRRVIRGLERTNKP